MLPVLPVLLLADARQHFRHWFCSPAPDQRLLGYSDSAPPQYSCGLLHRLQVLIV